MARGCTRQQRSMLNRQAASAGSSNFFLALIGLPEKLRGGLSERENLKARDGSETLESRFKGLITADISGITARLGRKGTRQR